MNDLLNQLMTFLPPLILFCVGLIIVLISLSQRIAWQLEWPPDKLLRLLPIGLVLVIVALGWLVIPEIQSLAGPPAQTDPMDQPVTPTSLPPPFISIETPRDTLNCSRSDNTCWFTIQGIYGGVYPPEDHRIYTFVFPSEPRGPGFYLQNPPAKISYDGTWTQAQATYGNRNLPARSGQALIIQAVLVEKEAAYNGSVLTDLPPNFYLGTVETIEGLIKISEPIEIIVE